MRQAGYSWNKIQESIAPDVSKIVFWKIANKSYEPKSPLLRYKLGLPRMKEVEVCEEHGVVHEYDCGSQVVKPKPKRAHRPRPPRIAIRLDNPRSAAASVLNNMDEDKVKELVRLLEE
jgi:hypothetical protein